MKVLGLCSYPVEAAATRYRLSQFVGPLSDCGIRLDVRPFLSSEQFNEFYNRKGIVKKSLEILPSVFERLKTTAKIKNYDLIFVQREAMFFGPAFFERLYQKIGGAPMILDLDDATYIRYVSPTYGRMGSFFKFFGKTDRLIETAATVVCGNRFIAEYVEKKGKPAVVIPTVVDTDKFCPREKRNEVPVVGWVGTHSTFPFLESLFGVLRELAKKHRFILKIVGAGREKIEIAGVEIENFAWNLEREIADFQSLDIGLYPIKTSDSASAEWLLGKSGFKAIQYLAVGIPFVMTPIGVCAEIGEPNRTHFNAMTEEDWYNSLDSLLTDENLRRAMGAQGRKYSLRHYTVPAQVEILARTFRTVAAENF